MNLAQLLTHTEPHNIVLNFHHHHSSKHIFQTDNQLRTESLEEYTNCVQPLSSGLGQLNSMHPRAVVATKCTQHTVYSAVRSLFSGSLERSWIGMLSMDGAGL